MKKVTAAQIKSMMGIGGAEYARQEAWDIANAASAIGFIAAMISDEADEPGDVQSLANIIRSLMEFINGEITEMVNAAKQGSAEKGTTLELEGGKITVTDQAEPAAPLNLSYAKSIGVIVPNLAVKFVAKDEIKGYTFLWGSQNITDLEAEYFTRDTDFWDGSLGKSARPLTWNHAQDATFKASPVIGQIVDFGDDEIGRWYVGKLDRAHQYNKAIAELIRQGKLGTSSDSAPQYVERVKTGKATWLKTWAWFASALTDTPCEPRMIGSIDFIKSLGIVLPDTSKTAWDIDLANFDLLKSKLSIGD